MDAHKKFIWPAGQQAAVSLTYDDALPVHFEAVAPQLSEKKLNATFNICANTDFTENTSAWKQVAAMGHELGNHTLFHPCRREPVEAYSWLDPHYDLCEYTSQRWMDEMRVANCLLNQMDGQTERTFGNTCCHTSIGQGEKEKDLSEMIDRMFVAGRGSLNEKIVQPATLSFPALGHFSGDGKTFPELQTLLDEALRTNGWIILMFHGVGEGTHGLYIDEGPHAELVHYLASQSDRIWTDSMLKVAQHLKSQGYGHQV